MSRTLVLAIVLVALVVGAFLAGYIPGRSQLASARGELQMTEQTLAGCEERLKLARLRDLIGRMYLNSTEKNFGLAAERASEYFNLARDMAGQTRSADLAAAFNEISRSRDTVTAGLANGDPAVLGELRALFHKTLDLPGPISR
jgi:hypothetical protein